MIWLYTTYGIALLGFLIVSRISADKIWWITFLRIFTPFYFLPLLVFIPHSLWAKKIRTSLLLILIGIIGLLSYGGYFLPKTPAPASGFQFTYATFNVLDTNAHPLTVADWVQNVQPDIVTFQENSQAFTNVINQNLAATYPYRFIQLPKDFSNGNVILSKYPILSEKNIQLVPGDTFVQQRVVIQLNSKNIVLYNIHLDPLSAASPRYRLHIRNRLVNTILGYDNSQRNKQIEQLLTLFHDEVDPYLVSGDFNTSDQINGYSQLASVLKDSFREAGTGLGTTWPVAGVAGLPAIIPPFARLDYIWHSSAFEALSAYVGPPLGSDHLPVYVQISLG